MNLEPVDYQQADQQSQVGEDIHPEMQGIRFEGGRVGLLGYLSKIASNKPGCHGTKSQHPDPLIKMAQVVFTGESLDCLEYDPTTGCSDNQSLKKGRQGFEFPMAEGVALVWGLFGMSNRHEIDPGHQNVK